MSDINYWLNRKYANQEFQSQTGRITGEADARLANTRADVLPETAAAEAAANRAGANVSNTRAELMPQESGAAVAQGYASAARSGQEARGLGFANDINERPSPFDAALLRSRGYGGESGGGGGGGTLPSVPGASPIFDPNTSIFHLPAHMSSFGPNQQPGYHDGTTMVPGQGSGKVDTVHAMLAPGEAVLNRGAADHLGRGMIEVLNHIGMARMGMMDDRAAGANQAQTASGPAGQGTKDDRVGPADAAQTGGKPGHYAKGTSKVAKGKPSDTPAGPAKKKAPEIDPAMLAALLHASAAGAAGHPPPAPGAGMPSPMPMPGGPGQAMQPPPGMGMP